MDLSVALLIKTLISKFLEDESLYSGKTKCS